MGNKNGLGYAFQIAIGISMVVLLLGNNASAVKVVVPDDSRIQMAIDNATVGETIEVPSGIYYENVNVNKQLTLRGIGNPVVNAGGEGSAITLSADGIMLEGFYATGAGLLEAGIKVISNNNTLIGNTANFNIGDHSVSGISLESSNNNTLISNNASFNGGKYDGSGISLESSSSNTLISNNISFNGGKYDGSGVSLTSSSNNLIYNNILNNTNNIYFDNSININNWNITSQSGTNIIKGSILGGNFWADPDGTGSSQTCADKNKDGICDLPFELDENNIDQIPLAAPDKTPPSSITNLTNISNALFFINWTWTDPSEYDFDHVEVYLDNVFKTNVSNGPGSYNATGLSPDTSHTIGLRSVDTSGNVNQTWNNHTARTMNLIVITITSPINNSENNTGFINVTVTLDRNGTAFLNWEGSNESMIGEGKYFSMNKTGLLSGNYSFRVYANDPDGVFNVSETRIITVNRTKIDDTIGNFINTSTFIVNTTLEIASPGGNTTLIIPNGTNASAAGAPVMSISIDSIAKIESTLAGKLIGNDKFIGEIVSLGPSGAVFDPPIQIRFNYTDAQISAEGISESDLSIKYYNTSSNNWEMLEIFERNTNGNYLIVNISHFSTVALIGTTVTAAAPPPSRSGGGGGGGGGGGTSGEDFTNIIVKERYDLFIYKDTVTSYKFKNINNPILTINIVGNVNAGEIGTSVEVLKNKSYLVKSPAPGNVYKNVNIWVGTSGFGSSKNIKEAVITFRVENSWTSSNNIRSNDIKMVRWDGSIWDQLETSEKTKDSTYIYFESKTNSFSVFAITGIEKKDPLTDITGPTKPAAAIQPVEKTSDFITNWFIIIGLFFAIGLVIEIYLRVKKK